MRWQRSRGAGSSLQEDEGGDYTEIPDVPQLPSRPPLPTPAAPTVSSSSSVHNNPVEDCIVHVSHSDESQSDNDSIPSEVAPGLPYTDAISTAIRGSLGDLHLAEQANEGVHYMNKEELESSDEAPYTEPRALYGNEGACGGQRALYSLPEPQASVLPAAPSTYEKFSPSGC